MYKVTIGALHVWSWRTTPINGCSMLWVMLTIARHVVYCIFGYTSIMGEPDIPEHARFSAFEDLFFEELVYLFGMTLLLLVHVSFMALVSSKYKRLRVLVATLRLPEHRLEDFSILQDHNACVTVLDMPITAATAAAVFQLAFVQVVLLALSAASVGV